MSRKSVTSFNLNQNNNSRSSVYDRIVREIDAKEIPAKYIDIILIQYFDGNIVELSGKDITCPIPLNRTISWGEMETVFKKMKDVKIFVALDKLEEDIDDMVEQLLGPYC